jgi:hypothetical protein
VTLNGAPGVGQPARYPMPGLAAPGFTPEGIDQLLGRHRLGRVAKEHQEVRNVFIAKLDLIGHRYSGSQAHARLGGIRNP